jgi:hypothetical protein
MVVLVGGGNGAWIVADGGGGGDCTVEVGFGARVGVTDAAGGGGVVGLVRSWTPAKMSTPTRMTPTIAPSTHEGLAHDRFGLGVGAGAAFG